MDRHRGALLLLPMLAAVALAIFPYVLYHVPFSTDSWPQIRNAQQIITYSPAPFSNSSIFQTYNIFWPADSIFGAIGSLMFGTAPVLAMPLLLPILAAAQVIILFVITEELTKNSTIASIASFIFATASFHDLFAAAVTKETFANPIFLLCMLLLVKKTDKRIVGLFGVSLFALNLSEHATTLFFLGALGSIVLLSSIVGKRKGEKIGLMPLLPMIGVAITSAYFVLYADMSSFPISQYMNQQTVITALSFLGVVLVPVVYYSLSKPRRILPIEESVIFCIVVVGVVVSSKTSLIPDAPTLPSGLLYFVFPYLAVGFFALIGYRIMQARMDRKSFGVVGAWLGCAIGLAAFASFSALPGGVFLTYRMFEYLYAPIAILAGITLWKASALNVKHIKLSKLLIVVVLVSITIATSYQTYAIVTMHESLFGGHWAYEQSDLAAARWTRSTTEANITLSGDSHVQYLFGGYFQMNVSETSGYEYLLGLAKPNGLLVTYSLMEKNGYVLFLYGEPLPNEWMLHLENASSLVYANGNVMLWG